MNALGFGNPWLQPVKLDPEAYGNDPAARALAELVSEEVEAEREAERAQSKPIAPIAPSGVPSGKGLLGGWNDVPTYWCDSRRWFEYAALPQVIERCALRVGVKAASLAAAISRLLRPANWMTFYWYSEYLNQTDQTLAALRAGIDRHQRADEAAVKRVREVLARKAGLESGKVRAKKAWLTPEAAARERDRLRAEGMPEHRIVGVIADDFKYADPKSVRSLLRKHDEKTTD
jgi:hypothetical protein